MCINFSYIPIQGLYLSLRLFVVLVSNSKSLKNMNFLKCLLPVNVRNINSIALGNTDYTELVPCILV